MSLSDIPTILTCAAEGLVYVLDLCRKYASAVEDQMRFEHCIQNFSRTLKYARIMRIKVEREPKTTPVHLQRVQDAEVQLYFAAAAADKLARKLLRGYGATPRLMWAIRIKGRADGVVTLLQEATKNFEEGFKAEFDELQNTSAAEWAQFDKLGYLMEMSLVATDEDEGAQEAVEAPLEAEDSGEEEGNEDLYNE